MRLVSRLVVVAASLGLAACNDANSPAPPKLDGSFALTEYNGKVLPETLTYAITNTPDHTVCAILAVGGMLKLDSTVRTFAISVTGQSSCGNNQFVLAANDGIYEQGGQTLILTVPPAPNTASDTGEIDALSITLHGGLGQYAFAR